MRLLLVSDHYAPFVGGAHRQTQLLAENMSARGHQVSVASPWHGGLRRIEEIDGIVVRRVRQLRTVLPVLVRNTDQRSNQPLPDPVTILDLRRAIGASRPDIVHAYGWIAFSAAAALIGSRIPLLISARDYGYFCAKRTLVRKGVTCNGPRPLKCAACAGSQYGVAKGWAAAAGVAACRPLLRHKATGVHSVSAFVREMTFAHLYRRASDGRHGGPYDVIIPSFQGTIQAEADGEDTLTAAHRERLPQEPFIMFVGAFRETKGLDVLFEAYGRLASRPPLVLIGWSDANDSVREFPEDVVVLTDVSHHGILAAWDRAMFGVMPSVWPEPYGAVVAEAMSRGRPVIGTRPGGHADMIDETTGILVPQGDVSALAQAMQELIDDPERRAAMGRAGRDRARTLTASAVTPRFEQAYRDLLALEGSV